jgi:hypothetical protein
MKLTDNQKSWLGRGINIKWGVSRGRDSYGYTTCVLRDDRDNKWAGCNGGGYDMKGTVVGHWIAAAFPAELRKIKEADMPEETGWQSDFTRVCAAKCNEDIEKKIFEEYTKEGATSRVQAKVLKNLQLPRFGGDVWDCPTCGGITRDSRDGKKVSYGRKLYGLTFHDPNYDPGKAVIGKDCSDRTFCTKDGESEGLTVAEAEEKGVSLGLERYQAVYKASSPFATKRHTIPSIDGACGFSSVMRIFEAIGLTLNHVANTKKLDVFSVIKYVPYKSKS